MKISVALCTYNGYVFLEQQINSILNQTIPVNEIVVCDDVSSDNTVSILEKYNIEHPNLFSIHINETNLRSNKNFEKAIALCTGDYIFLSDQDDLWKTNKVEETLRIFNENSTAEGVFSNGELIDENNNIIFEDTSLWDSVYFFESKMQKPIDLFRLLILKSNYLTGATLCIKKEVKEFCFPFKTTLKTFLHDEWFAMLLSNRNTLFYTTEKLISYRIHSQQQIGVGEIEKNRKIAKDLPKSFKLMMGFQKATTFNDFKLLTRNLYKLYIKHKESELCSEKNPLNIKIEEKIKGYYLEADRKMKKANPLFYFFRKWEDKRKGKRQL